MIVPMHCNDTRQSLSTSQGVARLWRATLVPGLGNAYDRFSKEVSLPMFRSHEGFLGVAMMRNDQVACVITYWTDHAAVRSLEVSDRYAVTVEAIMASGFISTFGETVVMETHLADIA